jgi:opacity protein-like surface antigen
VVAALIVGTAGVAEAQKVEVTPFVGYQFGGEIRLVDGNLRLQDDMSYGVVLDYTLNRQAQLEFSYTRQDTKLEFNEFQGGRRPIYDVSVNYWQLGGLYRFNPTATVRPFLTGTLGFTYYGVGDQLDDDAPRINSDTFFSMVFGGGVKIFPSERIGIRLAGHLYSTIISSGGGFWCGTGGCGVGLSGWGVWQGDVSAGLIIAM